MKIPEIGDKLYLPTQLHISRGEDDIFGGIAEISFVEISKYLPIEHINAIMVKFKGFSQSHLWNYKLLLEKQKEYSIKYADKIAKPDPDINTPWIESGDIVNGVKYTGKSIW